MLIPSALEFILRNRNHLPVDGSVLDFGDQKLFDRNHAKSLMQGFEELASNSNNYEQVSIIYKLLGFIERKCIDYNQNADYRINLNYSALSNPEIENKFDFVTNQGFSEHVFNQHAAFEAIHYTCKESGLMLHVLPCQGWADGEGFGHGFYQYQPNFFRHLAKANNYRIVDLQISPHSVDPHLVPFSPINYPAHVNFHVQPSLLPIYKKII